MLGELTSAEIEDVLHSEVVGRIGCIGEGRPYVVPTCYVYRDGCVYGHTAEGMKWRALRTTPDVCFEVEDVMNLSSWRSVIAWGSFEELTGDDADRGLRILLDRLLPLLHIDHSAVASMHGHTGHATVYRIRLHEKTGRFERHDAAGVPAMDPADRRAMAPDQYAKRRENLLRDRHDPLGRADRRAQPGPTA